MPRINLLPWREAERKRKRQEFFLSLGAAVATAALITLLGHWQMSSAIDNQRERNDYLNREIAGLDKQIEEINGLDAQTCVQYPTGAQPELYRVSLEGGMPEQILSTPTMYIQPNRYTV